MAPVTSPTASPASSRSAIWAAWAVLIGMGGTEMVYNIWHAIFTGHMHWGLALLYGLAPVAAAVLLSHIVAEHDGGWFLQGATFAVMLSAMALSAYATASVTKPAAGTGFAWVFGLTLDAAALLALNVIFSSRKRKAAAAAAREAERAEVAQAVADRSRLEAELASVRAESARQLKAVSDQLETVRTAHTALLERTAVSDQRRRKPARENTQAEDLTTELRAIALLDEDRSLRAPRMGGELARRLGVSPATGGRLHKRLTARYRSGESLSERSAEQPGERSDERS